MPRGKNMERKMRRYGPRCWPTSTWQFQSWECHHKVMTTVDTLSFYLFPRQLSPSSLFSLLSLPLLSVTVALIGQFKILIKLLRFALFISFVSHMKTWMWRRYVTTFY